MTATLFTKGAPNGVLKLPLGWRGGFRELTIYGGPYDRFPGIAKMYGVCVRAERAPKGQFHVHLPIEDFSVPEDHKAVERALISTFSALLNGSAVYVGCAGGWGRTGLFLALLAKAAGIKAPVAYVRNHYTPHAVETKQQLEYVARFDVSKVRQHALKQGWRSLLRGKKLHKQVAT